MVSLLDPWQNTCENLREYLKRTKKPKSTKVRQWVQRVHHLHLYLKILSGGKKGNFNKKEVSRKCISLNIPLAWSKNFRLRESNEDKSGKKNWKTSKDKSKSEKLENLCKLKGHSNHDWLDFFKKPKSKNSKGTAKNLKDKKKKGDKSNLIEQLEGGSVDRDKEFYTFHVDETPPQVLIIWGFSEEHL